VGGVNLEAVMKECAQVMTGITGLRVRDHPPADLSPPGGYVTYPESIDFDQTYGRGTDRIIGLPIVLVVGVATERSARDTASAWAAGGGDQSVKAAFEAHQWTSCDDLTISSVRFDGEEIAGVPYLAAIFTADALGSGGS
jgi:hypothetical protein